MVNATETKPAVEQTPGLELLAKNAAAYDSAIAKHFLDWKVSFNALAAPFTDDELEWRVLRKGTNKKGVWCMLAPYVDSRAIQNRLDEVVGPAGWQNRIQVINIPSGKEDPPGQTAMTVGIGILIGTEWIWKWDGADFSRGIEITKSAISDGLKRAASLWGIGRWLYTLPQTWGQNITEGYPPRGKNDAITFKEDSKQYWCPAPKLGMKPASAKGDDLPSLTGDEQESGEVLNPDTLDFIAGLVAEKVADGKLKSNSGDKLIVRLKDNPLESNGAKAIEWLNTL